MFYSLNTKRLRRCDGVSRRHVLQVGAISAAGLTLADVLRAEAAPGGSSAKAKSVILLWLEGGPSHMETWDPKPDAPVEYRGSVGAPVNTNVSGIRLGEKMVKSAQVMDRFSILRSVWHNNDGHEPAQHGMSTGYFPAQGIPENDFPSIGSVAAHELEMRNGLPAYVCVPNKTRSAGPAYLGAGCAPFSVDGNPADKNFRVRDLKLPGNVSDERFSRRSALLGAFDRTLQRRSDPNDPVKSTDEFYGKALGLVTSPKALEAFDLNKEPEKLRDTYGRNVTGQGCLLARRLVESGVRFVMVGGRGYDSHSKHFDYVNSTYPELDMGWAALVSDLHERGMLDETLVVAYGEFGRTPKINKDAGRDHWGKVFSVAMAGGGIRPGQAIGSSDTNGEEPRDRPIHFNDVHATMYRQLGIDIHKAFLSGDGRPTTVLPAGAPIPELI